MSPRPLASEPVRVIDTPYLNSKECAAYLKFKSVRALYKAISSGIDIPVLRRGGHTMLFHRDHLDRWLAGESRLQLLRSPKKVV